MLTKTKLPDPNDTIVALSSAAGPGARAIVRLSGQRAAPIVAAVCPTLRAAPGQFFQGGLRLAGFHAEIPADIYYFAAPKTYTGQDVIEIHMLACAPIVEGLIAACLNAGARAAQPGEFTMRAFLAGKLDLTRAEAVHGVIEATSRTELKHALTQLAGGLAQPLHELREDLLNLLADVEAGLDFAEENIQFVSADEMLKRLAKGLAYLMLLQKQIEQRAIGQRPFRVVLAGLPNAGKSSLFNALVGRDAALVSAEPGTTRDYLERTIDADGMAIDIVDTAGLGEAADAIDESAQTLGQEAADRADLILWCSACDQPLESSPHAPREDVVTRSVTTTLLAGVECWLIATKADLGQARDTIGIASHELPATSAATGAGVAELRERLAKRMCHAGHAALAPSLSRCRHHVEACLAHLRSAHTIVLDEEMPELLALEIRLALDELGAMVGAVYTDDLLDRVFSRFCIGK